MSTAAPRQPARAPLRPPARESSLSPQNIARILFSATTDEPRATPAMARFFRGLVVGQSYVIALLVATAILTSLAFKPRVIYHLAVLDKDGLPSIGRDAAGKAVPGQYFYPPYLMYPLEEPNLTHTAILNMAMNLATQVLTFGFNNADARLLDTRHYFTEDAWQRFARAYLQSGRLDTIKRNQQVLTAIASDGAVVVSEGKESGVDRWVVQAPIITTYQAGKTVTSKRSVLQITLQRASTIEHPEGVAIAGWEELAAGLGVRRNWDSQ